MRVCISRYFVFSERHLPKDLHYAFGNLIGNAEEGETVTLKTIEIIYRSYFDADELTISFMKILQISSIECPIYNLGS